MPLARGPGRAAVFGTARTREASLPREDINQNEPGLGVVSAPCTERLRGEAPPGDARGGPILSHKASEKISGLRDPNVVCRCVHAP